MNLGTNAPIAFIPTRNPAAAREFYERLLGLPLESEDVYALVFRAGSTPGLMLRVVHTPNFTPAGYTIFGWQVRDVVDCVKQLTAAGITPARYAYFEQDELGIWSSPGGSKVAWFKDPDGNTLSVTQLPA